MSPANTWLLPDGVSDILPKDALAREQLRRQILDVLLIHGYELVDPPLIEYTESLLNCAGERLKRQTFRIVDQLTGRLMGIRADITHQVARIDAHAHSVDGVARYCYAAPVLRSRPDATFASRTPFQIGAELYGHTGITADLELLDLLLTILEKVMSAHPKNAQTLHLDVGNVAIFRALAVIAGINADEQQHLLQLYDKKALPELKAYCQNITLGDDFYTLAIYSQDLDQLMANLSPSVKENQTLKYAIYDLKRVFTHLQQNWSGLCHASVDAAELSSFHYHTGIVFSLYDGANPLAKGGRYDGIGKNFGRTRAATGFSCDLDKLLAFLSPNQPDKMVIAAPMLNDAALATLVSNERNKGHIVVNKLSASDGLNATHAFELVAEGQQKSWQLVKLK